MIKQVTLKIGNMRKAQDFVVYPDKGGGEITIQSNDCIAKVNAETGETFWARNKGGAYPHHLFTRFRGNLGSGTITLTADELQSVKDAQAQKGDQIGPGVFVG